MDDFAITTSRPVIHKLELYTGSRLIQGNVAASFKRTSDMLNRKDRNFLTVQDGVVTPLSQPASSSRLDAPVTVARSHVHLVSPVPGPNPESRLGRITSPNLGEYHVKKIPFACCVLTGAYSVYGHCYLLPDANLENWLDTVDVFIPLTDATISLVANPNVRWRRDLVIVNKEKLEEVYWQRQSAPANAEQISALPAHSLAAVGR